MSTAVPASPALATPGPTAQFLAKLSAFAGLALILVSVLLALLHPLPDAQRELLAAGLALVGSSAGIYGVLTSVLKYAAMARKLEPEANVVAAAIPGAIGSDVQKALALVEKLIDALPDPGAAAPAPSPVAVAAAAGVEAASNPAKTL